MDDAQRDLHRRMARFELAKARRLLADGDIKRAAMALKRAKLWRVSREVRHGLTTKARSSSCVCRRSCGASPSVARPGTRR